jgi:histidyl-tRNA synthetase
MAVRNRVINILRGVFEKYGFSELQTPALEYQEVLLGKYGEEAEKLMYLFEDSGQRKVGMKYDLTVPLARVMATHQDLPKPFKRYQIQPVWRAENTQKGRYREFYQCDVDTIGSNSPLADAEIFAVINDSLEALGFENYSININSREVLFSLMKQSGLPEEKYLTTIQSIDKLDKKSEDEVKEELSNKGLTREQIEHVFSAMKLAKPDDFLKETMDFARKFGVDDDRIYFSPSLARGLDYYTGPIFETVITEPKIGSITGGGRYDNLLKSIGGPDEPAVGTTIGMDRIVDVLTELDLQADISSTTTQVLVTIFNENTLNSAIDIANTFRDAGINTEILPDTTKSLDKQLKYADKKEIPYALIQGPEELAKNVYVLKDLRNRTQETMPFEQVLATLMPNS